jgi:hypothetical protein
MQVVGSSPQLSMAGQVYWIGNDGNVYLHNADGTATNMGAAAGTGTTANLTLNGATQIANPGNPGAAAGGGATTAPSAPSTNKPLNTGAVQNTQATIDQIPALLQAALASEDQSYANTNNLFDQQEQTQRGTYDASSTTNQQNYDSNFMDSIRAGIKGLGGLMALLRGTGAAGGTAEDMVHDVVGGTTANDIRGGKDTRDQNQGALDSSLATFLTDLKGKRQTNADTHVNNARSITRDENTQLQDLYSKMAGYYGDAGMTGQANDFMGRAGALTPTIAANSTTRVSPYDTAPVVIHAPNLTAFSAPSQPNVATVPEDGQVGSGIFAINKKRDQQDTQPVAAAQGA